MKILQMMASGERGGGANHLLGVVGELQRRQVACVVAVGDNGPTLARTEAMGCELLPLRVMGRRLSVGVVAQVRRAIERSGADVVHCHGTRAALLTALAARFSPAKRRPPFIYTAHGLSYRKRWFTPLLLPFFFAEQLICREAAAVVSVSQQDLLDLRRRGYLGAEDGMHIGNAVHVEGLLGDPATRPERRRNTRSTLGVVDESTCVVGTVARLVPQKAVRDLLSAFAADERLDGARLVVVGDGPLRADLEAQAKSLGIAERCLFLGERADVPDLLLAFDVFALSSHWEGEPIALLEALAAELPIVATANTGATDILAGSDAAVLTPVADTNALGRALGDVVSDSHRRQGMRRAASALLQGRTYAAVTEQLLEVYQRVLASRVTA